MNTTGSRIARLARAVASGVCGVALAATPAAAQGTAGIRVTTDFLARVVSGAGEQRRWIPTGAMILGPQRVYAWEQGVVMADGTVGPRTPFGMEVSGLTTAVRGSVSDASLSGAFEWSIDGSGRGWLTVELSAQVMPLVWGGEAWLDVTAPGIRETHHIVPPTSYGLDRRLERFVSFTDGLRANVHVWFASGQTGLWTTYAHGYVRLTFVPALPPIDQMPFGEPCGASVAVTDATTSSHHDVRLTVETGLASAPVAMLFGGHRVDPPARCGLLLEPIAAIVTLADESGRAVVAFPMPGPLRSPPFVVQAFGLGPDLQLRTTAGTELQFVD